MTNSCRNLSGAADRPGAARGRQGPGVSRWPRNRYIPSGTMMTNRAPCPSVPVSRMVIPVMERISRAGNRPDRRRPVPVFLIREGVVDPDPGDRGDPEPGPDPGRSGKKDQDGALPRWKVAVGSSLSNV